jgi:hypothetical protein
LDLKVAESFLYPCGATKWLIFGVVLFQGCAELKANNTATLRGNSKWQLDL